jgi:hypothetical protein
LVVGSFDEAAFVEVGASADEGDEVGCVDVKKAAAVVNGSRRKNRKGT